MSALPSYLSLAEPTFSLAEPTFGLAEPTFLWLIDIFKIKILSFLQFFRLFPIFGFTKKNNLYIFNDFVNDYEIQPISLPTQSNS